MEKYSAYRDPGTGIQPFLAPVAPPSPNGDILAKTVLPIRYFVGAVRMLLVLLILGLYLILVEGICFIFRPVAPLYRILARLFIALLSRLALLSAGIFWIHVEHVKRRRGQTQTSDQWNPQPGDVIVSNWVSWIEILWLAFRFNPVFVLPVPASSALTSAPSKSLDPISRTPGRRTGTGLANVSVSTRAPRERIPIIGFQRLSLLNMLRQTGNVPPYRLAPGLAPQSLEAIRSTSDRPIVVFPESTTSNGRGLIRFCDVFNQNIPVQGWQAFVMCVRYDTPTILSSTLSHSIPARSLNPLPQVFNMATSITPPTVSIRLLAPSESPGSPNFLASDVLAGSHNDQLSEACAVLIAQLGKMKRIGMGWEDKANFLEFYWGRRSS
ncbi:uncharacterized protein BT62DRAFT_945371 [Guyanagaster necrorhizus]|uniref:Phospholipid/glycerol acyltransferase domain-containing protein n=1 Tax=Guyanagaster necrorhizus TaxID=856835 RepID=A0A9P7VZ87_9AGAR|nr:uncharacterized protein BT62DRAFT_945371 [Guyanagaster necrorhizus MCA 3950]KAG7449262.1 hypothetical protein BT62DRAFT_945371 [Guyanagaster necrorhizus MCA 3950]